MLEAYRNHVADRDAINIPPKPLSAQQVADLVELLKAPPSGEESYLLDLISSRVPPGVDEAAYVKAAFLSDIALGKVDCPIIDKANAIDLLGDMHGGYNIETLVTLLRDAKFAGLAAKELKHTLLMFEKSQLWQCHNVQVADSRSGPKSTNVVRNGSRMVART